jgi:hypothetical protein
MEDEVEIKMILKKRIKQAFEQIREQGLGGAFYTGDKTLDYMVDSSFKVLEITQEIQEYIDREIN